MSRRIAVLIASSSFPDEPQLAALEAPERDVNGIREVLAADKGGVFDETVVLVNQPSQKVRLTPSTTCVGDFATRRLLRWLSRDC